MSTHKNLYQITTIILVLGLIGTTYLYIDTKSSLNTAREINSETQLEVSQLTQSIEEISEELQTLIDSNTELETRISELELGNNTGGPSVVVETPEVILSLDVEGEVRNIILLIGDGMGPGQLTAAEIENGEDTLAIIGLPYMSMVSTDSYTNYVTDSAASATALATGYKTKNGVISIGPNGETLTTVVEVAEEHDLSTGIVSNTRVTHATPAAFMSHVNSRNHESLIAEQVLLSGVDVVLGGGSSYFSSLDPSGAGYTVVETIGDLMDAESGKVLGLFTSSYMSYELDRNPLVEPSLAEMTEKAIELLSSDTDGFFLMVEGGRIDHASHDNNIEYTLSEVYAFDLAVLEALEFASGRNDTLVIVTADHETGGLLVTGGYPGGEPSYSWISDGHTGSMVPVFAFGPRAEEVLGFSDNTDIGMFLVGLFD